MRKITSICSMVILMVAFISVGSAEAIDTVTAEQAFDAYMAQEDPYTGPAKVILVDIRTTAEYYWIGTCAEVTGLWKKIDPNTQIIPDKGKVKLVDGYLEYEVEKVSFSLYVNEVEEITTSPIAINIPYQTWRRDKNSYKDKVYNPHFGKEIEALAEFDVNGDPTVVIILTCRSGKRTSASVGEDPKNPEWPPQFDLSYFKAVYEIDYPLPVNARGGIQGSDYSEAYNGFRGFPGRDTSFQSPESVSWYDAGLPIHIGAFPE